MKLLCKNLVAIKPKTLTNFLDVVQSGRIRRTSLEICVPDSYALRGEGLESIIPERCTGCMACIDQGEVEYITRQGVPTSKDSGYKSLHQIASTLFQGSYVRSQFSNKLANHTSKNETRILNPLSAVLLWRLSQNPSATYFSSSPNWELSIDTMGDLDEREGHLDVVLASPDLSLVITLEGKKTVEDALSSRHRGQWNRYRSVVEESATNRDYVCLFSYLIGGSELPLYPPGVGAPHHMRRSEFFDLIRPNHRRFISIEALRALRVFKISRDPEWSWESFLPKLFSDPSFLGIVSGGIIYREDNRFQLEPAPWI